MIFTIKVNYKSGISHTFDVTEFEFNGRSFTLKPVEDSNKPVILGADHIESVWQVGMKEKDNV